MTIFLEVLYDFISKRLDKISTHLEKQGESLFYNTEASKSQNELVIELKKQIELFKKDKANKDAVNHERIISYITDYTTQVEDIRVSKGVETDVSVTLGKLASLSRRTTNFYKEISSDQFFLLDIRYDKDQCAKFPRLHVYYAVAFWLAQQIFEPLTISDEEIKRIKIEQVGYRLQQLDALLKTKETNKTLSPSVEIDLALKTCADLCGVDDFAKKTKSSKTSKASKQSSSILTKFLPVKLKIDLTFWGLSLTGHTKIWYDRLTESIREAQKKLEQLQEELESSTSKKSSDLPIKPHKPVNNELFNKMKQNTVSEDEDEDEDEDAQSENSLSNS